MKIKLLLILVISALSIKAQETTPVGLKSIKAEFYIAQDAGIWQNKGVPYNWHRVARYSDITGALSNYYSQTVSDNRFVPLTRTWTINGVPYDFTINRALTISDATKLPLSGGELTGSINYSNLSSGIGINWTKNTDWGKIYFESTGDDVGDANQIFETGDNISGHGGPTEGWIFRKNHQDSGPLQAVDILKINATQFKYKTFDIAHSGNLGTGLTYSGGLFNSHIHDNKAFLDGIVASAYVNINVTGSAARLTTARKINNVDFDGTTDITLPSTAPDTTVMATRPYVQNYTYTKNVIDTKLSNKGSLNTANRWASTQLAEKFTAGDVGNTFEASLSAVLYSGNNSGAAGLLTLTNKYTGGTRYQASLSPPLDLQDNLSFTLPSVSGQLASKVDLIAIYNNSHTWTSTQTFLNPLIVKGTAFDVDRIVLGNGNYLSYPTNRTGTIAVTSDIGIAVIPLMTTGDDYLITPQDATIILETAAAVKTFTLPDVSSVVGRQYTIGNFSGFNLNLVVAGGASTLRSTSNSAGVTLIVIPGNGNSMRVQSNGAYYYVLNH
jgi:hypothetical protein